MAKMSTEQAIESLKKNGSPFAGGEAEDIIKNGLSEKRRKQIASLRGDQASDRL